MRKESAPGIQARISRLGEDVYEHFLRQAGDCADPEEWYTVAIQASEMFCDQIVQSQIKGGNNRGGKSRTAIELTRLEVRIRIRD